jgi:hypothetical protein
VPKLVVDGLEVDSETLSERGQAQFASLQFAELQLARLRQEIAVYTLARNAYLAALKNELAKSGG